MYSHIKLPRRNLTKTKLRKLCTLKDKYRIKTASNKKKRDAQLKVNEDCESDVFSPVADMNLL